MPTSPNAFVWYELMTTDPDSAEAFYRAVVGWGAQDAGQGGMHYTLLTADDRPVAGLMGLPQEACAAGARPGWIGYIGVDDVDAAADGIRQADGAVRREPDDIPGVGRFAVVADPQGATFMLFKPMGASFPLAPTGTPGHVGWRELYAADGARAFDFYAGQFGWTKADALDMGPMGVYQLFAAGGDAIGGMMTKPDAIPVPIWLFYFNVPAIEAAAARVAEHGGRVLHGPLQVPGGSWIVQAQDPQGVIFALVAPQQ